MLIDLPCELLSDIVEGLVCEYLFEYFTSHGAPWPWNAISALSGVSVTVRAVVCTLLSSALSIPRLKDGRLSKDPNAAISLAQTDADVRFHAARRHFENNTPIIEDNDEHAWWKDSPLLELYSIIRETRFKNDWIMREGHHIRRLADLPKRLVMPMEKVKIFKDRRLIWPALMEGARLIACTSFVGQLAASAMFFELVHVALRQEPSYTSLLYDSINKTLVTVEALERNCMLPLRWVQVERPTFVKASHIYASDIVPALNSFLRTPVITSDPMCARWRLSVDLLLKAWAPLDNQIRIEKTNQSSSPESLDDSQQSTILEFPQDVSP